MMFRVPVMLANTVVSVDHAPHSALIESVIMAKLPEVCSMNDLAVRSNDRKRALFPAGYGRPLLSRHRDAFVGSVFFRPLERLRHAAFCVGVFHVVRVCSEKQMFRIYATRIVAAMQNVKRFVEWSVSLPVGCAVRSRALAVEVGRSVTGAVAPPSAVDAVLCHGLYITR